jgi:HEPN domain-containing protein
LKPPDEVRRDFTKQWLRKGTKDLASAKQLLSGGEEFAYGAAFHAQQAAEKFLKAALVWHQVEFPKTYDIARLVDLVRSRDGVLADLTAETAVLTPYGVDPLPRRVAGAGLGRGEGRGRAGRGRPESRVVAPTARRTPALTA